MMIWAWIFAIMAVLMPTDRNTSEQGDMLPLLKRHEIQVLLKAGFSAPDVAHRADVSVATVRRVRAEDQVTHTDDVKEHARRKLGRPSKAAPLAAKVRGWLEKEPELATLELLRRAKEQGYSGKKTAFYALVAGARPPRVAPVVRFEGVPGEFSQHDFGQVEVSFVDGTRRRIHFFASRLKYSRFARVTLVDNERVETVLRCLARDFVAFGGIPLLAVFDRPRTIVTKGGKGREVEAYNQTFAQGIVDLGVGVEMCAPRSGNQKGSVERIVGWVKNSFFKPRKFQDMEDLQAQLEAWLDEINTKLPSRATGVIPEIRRQEESSRLRPVKVLPENLALRLPIFVGPTAEVVFEGASYTMPPGAAHVAGTLFLYEKEVLIVAGRFQSRQRRRSKEEPAEPVPEHRAEKLAAVHGTRAKLYEKRQQLLNVGPDALTVVTELVHQHPRGWMQKVEELYDLLERYGNQAMRTAFREAVAANLSSVGGVRHFLLKAASAGDDNHLSESYGGPGAKGGHS